MIISRKMKNHRNRALAVAVLAAGLAAAPWSMQPGSVLSRAAAQTAAPSLQAAPGSNTAQAETKKPPSAGQVAMHERQKKMRGRMETGQGRRQAREGNEVAEVLERVQQAAQGRRLITAWLCRPCNGGSPSHVCRASDAGASGMLRVGYVARRVCCASDMLHVGSRDRQTRNAVLKL